MRLLELDLAEFRAYRSLHLVLDPAGFRAIGPNASGKSTLLEAISMLSTTRSPRTSNEREIANWESGASLSLPPYARLRGAFERSGDLRQIEIGMSLDEHGQGMLRKRVRLDERPVRAIDAVGELKTVHFSPDDVNLVTGTPSARRRFLDMAIGQASQPYLRSLSRYGRVLEQRNSLLKSFAGERAGSGSRRVGQELAFWDGELTASAADVLATRIAFVSSLGTRAQEQFAALTGDDSLALSYHIHRFERPLLPAAGEDWRAPSQPYRQSLAAEFGRALQSMRGEELRRGVTAIGPQRDDIGFSTRGADLSRFGSRGQQRLALVAAKLAELDLLTDVAGEPPVLLLDDVLSELDARHRREIVATLASRRAQICVTATDDADLGGPELRHLPLLRTGLGFAVGSEGT